MNLFIPQTQEILQNNFPEYTFVFLENIDSTQLECQRRWENDSQRRWLILSNQQTQGHGRYGRTWQSSPNTNIYISWIQSNFLGKKIAFLNLWCGILLFKAISSLYGKFLSGLTLKWPNDLYVGSKKIAGILLQMLDTEFQNIIVGIGINVHSNIEQIPDTATSISLALQQYFSKDFNNQTPLQITRLDIIQNLLAYFQKNETNSLEKILQEFEECSQYSRKINYNYSCYQYYYSGMLQKLHSDGTITILTEQGELVHLKN